MIKPLQIECTGYSIAADWHEGADTSRILLVLPGFTSSKKRQKAFASSIIARTGMSALVIDYSGHGDSPFEIESTRPAQHLLEVVCAFDWLRENYPEAELNVAGGSYGSFLGAWLTQYRKFEKLVLRAPAIYEPAEFYTPWSVRFSDKETYRSRMDVYRHDTETLKKHPLLAQASEFKGKTLVVVHENDETIPRETSDVYIDTFGAESFIAKGFTHSVNASPVDEQQLEDYQSHIADWLK